jgi:hypothetical protein
VTMTLGLRLCNYCQYDCATANSDLLGSDFLAATTSATAPIAACQLPLRRCHWTAAAARLHRSDCPASSSWSRGLQLSCIYFDVFVDYLDVSVVSTVFAYFECHLDCYCNTSIAIPRRLRLLLNCDVTSAAAYEQELIFSYFCNTTFCEK